MQYTTTIVTNILTGEHFTFEVKDEVIACFERQKALIRSGGAPALGTIEDLTCIYEFGFFPSYEEVIKIFFENGYTDELALQILSEFGITEEISQVLLDDSSFVKAVKPWFEGVTCDGVRASRTIATVYNAAKSRITKVLLIES